MSLIIKNLADGSSQTIASGAVGFLTLQATNPSGNGQTPGRGLHIEWDSAEAQYTMLSIGSPPTVITETWGQASTSGATVSGIDAGPGSAAGSLTVSGDLLGSVAYEPIQQNDLPLGGTGDFLHATPAGFIVLNTPAPGTFYITIELRGLKGTEYCGVIVTVLPAYNLPLYAALSWMPTNMIDVQVDVNARAVNSALLSHTSGLKQGDDFKLAVAPYRAGSLMTSGITAMSLALIDRAGSPYAPLSFTATGSPPTFTTASPGGYYTISGNLRDASITAWFGDLNTRINALATAQAGNNNNPTPLPDRTRLEAIAQLHITTADGITTTQNFPLPLLAEPEALGIQAASSAATDSAIDLEWDMIANTVSLPALSPSNGPGVASVASGTPTPLLFLKEEDDLVARLHLMKNGSAVAPAVTACKLVLKELEPDNQIVVSDAFAASGSGDNFSVLLHAQFSGALLAAALSNYEADAGTAFSALAELEITYTNPFGIGPGTLTRTSKTFRIQIDRDLGEAA